MIQKIKKTREYLDGFSGLLKDLSVRSRELSLALTKIQESKMWLGQALKMTGSPNPYPDSRNVKNTNIEPTADKKEMSWSRLEGTGDFTHIQKVKFLRSKMGEAEKEYFQLIAIDQSISQYCTKSLDYLIESQMWLGMELRRIRDEN